LGPATYLLPAYDELLIGYSDRSAFLAERHASRVTSANGLLSSLMVEGRVVGTWRRDLRQPVVGIEARPLEPLGRRPQESLAQAARAYGRFLGLRAELSIT